ncbi:MAG TPA: hypothetical protein PKK10_11225 [Woeseiaceae bacterium]|nr:hypothetical protein [Woeseiaceae bacterium]
MTERSKFDDKEVLSSPELYFESPKAVLKLNKSDEEKVAILENWERSIRQLMVASGEGMPSGGTRTTDTAELLQKVHHVLELLGHPHDGENSQTDVAGSVAEK